MARRLELDRQCCRRPADGANDFISLSVARCHRAWAEVRGLRFDDLEIGCEYEGIIVDNSKERAFVLVNLSGVLTRHILGSVVVQQKAVIMYCMFLLVNSITFRFKH